MSIYIYQAKQMIERWKRKSKREKGCAQDKDGVKKLGGREERFTRVTSKSKNQEMDYP